jgi:hypothetical protein
LETTDQLLSMIDDPAKVHARMERNANLHGVSPGYVPPYYPAQALPTSGDYSSHDLKEYDQHNPATKNPGQYECHPEG